MSGASDKPFVLSRRDFLKTGAGLVTGSLFFSCDVSTNTSCVSEYVSQVPAGHLLRDGFAFPEPEITTITKVLIAGGGIGGLSTAYHLHKNHFTDFLLIESESALGGNSQSGKNEVSAYPYGAHYLPIPDLRNTELIQFLHEHNIITHFDQNGKPFYNEYYLCHEVQERLLYKGLWRLGFPPAHGLSQTEKHELARFHSIIENYKGKKGADGKPFFCIPVDTSSTDPATNALDQISASDYMKQHGFTTPFIYWYVNYCCKDDFGSDINTTSAWALLHYFCARNGEAANANSSEVLTWPEGNAFLAEKLYHSISTKCHTNHLLYAITEQNNVFTCLVYNTVAKTSKKIICEQLVLATPQFVNKRLLKGLTTVEWDSFRYYPWLLANITLSDSSVLTGQTGHTLAWDNILYDSPSLGYVNATHQLLHHRQKKTVITYYHNFSGKTPSELRKYLHSKDELFWKQEIIRDLEKAHRSIAAYIEHIDIKLLGHGMISPTVGFRSNPARCYLKAGIGNLHFAHTDISGISLFEEGFYQGSRVAKKLLTHASA